MKKLIFSVVLTVISVVSLNAQVYKGMGIKLGINESNVNSSIAYLDGFNNEQKYNTGFSAGIFREFDIYKDFKLIGYIGYTDKRRGGNMINAENKSVYETYDFKFISLELTGKWIPMKNAVQLYVLGGVGLDFFLSAGKSYPSELDKNYFLINRNKQLNAIVGGGVQYNLSPVSLFVEGVYEPHLTSLGVYEGQEVEHHTDINSFIIRTGIIF